MFSFFIKVMVGRGRHRSSEGRICEPGSNGVTNSRNQSPITNHLSPLTNHLSPLTSHQSPLTCLPYPSPIPPLSLPYPSHPCACRTETIAPRIEFQVCCFSITSFGNIQPSQQICWKALVNFP